MRFLSEAVLILSDCQNSIRNIQRPTETEVGSALVHITYIIRRVVLL